MSQLAPAAGDPAALRPSAVKFLATADAACAALNALDAQPWRVVRRGGTDVRIAGAADSEPTPDGTAALDDQEGFVLLGPAHTARGLELDRLSDALAEARAGEAEDRLSEASPRDGESDPSTGLGNYDTWKRVLAGEEAGCCLLGHPAVVALVRVSTPADRSDPEDDERRARRVAAALRRALRGTDVVCRLADSVYGVLAVECMLPPAVLTERLINGLLDAGLGAVAGAAVRERDASLTAAQIVAGRQVESALAQQRIVRL